MYPHVLFLLAILGGWLGITPALLLSRHHYSSGYIFQARYQAVMAINIAWAMYLTGNVDKHNIYLVLGVTLGAAMYVPYFVPISSEQLK